MSRSDLDLDGETRFRDIYWVPLDGPGCKHARVEAGPDALVIDYPETFRRIWPR